MHLPITEHCHALSRLKTLHSEVKRGSSRLIVVHGPRGIGKTALVKQAFCDAETPSFCLFVNPGMTERSNLVVFRRDNIDQLKLVGLKADFHAFEELLESFLDRTASEPIVFVIDEYQNCSSVAPQFPAVLERVWRERRKSSKLLLLLTVSTTATLLQSVAPVLAFSDDTLELHPISTASLKTLLAERNKDWLPKDLLTLYMISGGIHMYVEQLLDVRSLSQESLLHCAVAGPFFPNEGEIILKKTFSSRHAVYFELLSRIACGQTQRSTLARSFPEIDVSGHLHRLEEHYGLIVRTRPFGSPSDAKNYCFELTNDFLLFWFRFVYPNQALLESGAAERAVKRILAALSRDDGTTFLVRCWRKTLQETRRFSRIGPWWCGKNHFGIDLVATDPAAKEILFADVRTKCGPTSSDLLRQKAYLFLAKSPEYASWKPILKVLDAAALQ